MVFCCLFAHGTPNWELTLFPTMDAYVCTCHRISVNVLYVWKCECVSEYRWMCVYRARTYKFMYVERCSWTFVVLSLCCTHTAQGVFYANLLSTFSSGTEIFVHVYIDFPPHISQMLPSRTIETSLSTYTHTRTHQHLFIYPHFCAVVLVGNRSKQCNLIHPNQNVTIRARMSTSTYVCVCVYVFACISAIWKAKSWKNRYLNLYALIAY